MGINESIADDRISDLALREPVCCSPNEDIANAIQRLRDNKLGCLVVIDDDRKLLGTVTESMITQIVAKNPESLKGPVKGFISDTCPRVKLNDSAAIVLEAMQTQNTRFLCVVDEDERVVGLTGQKGLMEYVADHFPQQVMVLRVGNLPPADREGA